MLWAKALHFIFAVTWFAGIFYLPRLFVYHTRANSNEEYERFCEMERKLFYAIMTPGGVLALVFGFTMIFGYAWESFHSDGWLHVKLTCIALLVGYHIQCWRWMNDYKNNNNKHTEKYFRAINEIPSLILFAIVIMATVRPF